MLRVNRNHRVSTYETLSESLIVCCKNKTFSIFTVLLDALAMFSSVRTRMYPIGSVINRRNQKYILGVTDIHKRSIIYKNSKDGSRTWRTKYEEAHGNTPQEWQDLCEKRKKNPIRTFFSSSGDPEESFVRSYGLMFSPMLFMCIAVMAMKYLSDRENEKRRAAKDHRETEKADFNANDAD